MDLGEEACGGAGNPGGAADVPCLVVGGVWEPWAGDGRLGRVAVVFGGLGPEVARGLFRVTHGGLRLDLGFSTAPPFIPLNLI